MQQQNNIFRSFWMAGFECTDKLNVSGNRVDFLKLTGHLDYLEKDYKNLQRFGIYTVREGVRWSQVEKKPYQYNWTIVEKMIAAAEKYNIQQVWDLCHFGYPDDLTPLHPLFAQRFACFAKAFVKYYRSLKPFGELIIVPINEVSFISWLGGEVGATTPYTKGYGWQVKYNLMKAYIKAIEAMKHEDASISIVTSEPLINTVPPFDATLEQIAEAALKNEHQFQATDILAGRTCPELGGKEDYVDIIGLNYYGHNQWVYNSSEFLDWRTAIHDERFQPLHVLIRKVFDRYKKPVAITETSHPGKDRPAWFEMIERECIKTLQRNIPLKGICIYPIIDRQDWDDLTTWHHSGLWDIDIHASQLQRFLYQPMADAVLKAQKNVNKYLSSASDFSPHPKSTTLVVS